MVVPIEAIRVSSTSLTEMLLIFRCVGRRRYALNTPAYVLGVLFLCCLPSLVLSDNSVFSFDIPEQMAEKSLNTYAQQAGQPTLYLVSRIKGIKTNKLQGMYSAKEAILILLKDTGLKPLFSHDGVLTIEAEDSTSVSMERDEIKNSNNRLLNFIAMLFTVPSLAQGQPDHSSDLSQADTEEVLEVVVVKGIRRNITDAIISKRGSNVIVDGISADDIGSFPDVNVAEAMQQLPGVSITRNNLTGEGENVSVRGFSPGQTLSLMDGEQLLVGSFGEGIKRAFNYGMLPTYIVSKVDVYKSPQASFLEGGVGGTINVKTRRPLDIKEKATFVATVKSKRNELVEEIDPSVSFLGGWKNDNDNFGVLVSAGYQRIRTRADSLGNRAWDKKTVEIEGKSFTNTFVPFNSGAFLIEADREKIASLTSIEYQFSDDLGFKLDHFFTQETGSFGVGRNTTRQHTQATEGVDNNIGSATLLQSVVPNHNVATNINWVGASNVFDITRLDYPDYDAKSHNIILTSNMLVGDWDIIGKIGYAVSEGGTGLIRTATYLGDGDFITTGTDSVRNANQYFDAGTTNRFNHINPDNYEFRNYSEKKFSNENLRKFLRLDISTDINGSFFRGLKAGFYYQNTEREHWKNDLIVPGAARNALKLSQTLSGASYSLPSNYLDGFSIQGTPTQYITADTLATKRALDDVVTANGLSYGNKIIPGATYAIEEDYMSAFGQIDFANSFGNVEFRGNFGLRVTEQNYTIENFTSNVSDEDLNARRFDYTGKGDSVKVLPSLNLAFEFPSNVIVRFATSKVIGRPEFSNLARRLQLSDISQPGVALTATAGNPDLDPYEAQKYDLSAEWYYAEGSLISVALFYYDIASFIVTGKSQVDLFNDGNIWTVTRPENGEGGEIQGFEVGLSHQLTQLPSPFDGLGLQAAFTSIDSSATEKDPITGGALPITGLSENTYTVAITYSKDKWNGSIRYNARDDYYNRIMRGAPVYFEGTESLTAQVRYKFNRSLDMFLQGTNLTDWGSKSYIVDPLLQGQSRHIGRNFIVGANYRF